MSCPNRVLVVDDDADVRTALSDVYRRAGLEVDEVCDGRVALRHLYEQRSDLVVLDLDLPGLDGLTVLERIREICDVPVLILTARSREDDKVTALIAGADDYVTKPFSNSELMARTITLLRRSVGPDTRHATLDDGIVRMDLEQRLAWVNSAQVKLTPTDWALLLAFVQRPRQVLSAERLLELAWRDPFGIGPNRVKFAVMRLRRRLGWGDPTSSHIQSVRGVGYRYVPPPSCTATDGTTIAGTIMSARDDGT